ncbi:hypothetical protein SC499_10605 [Peribacillus simplex]|uniref:hypothetical protein n=1 Tax=Peribacillus simplex TaxID=1478 RepID=UPI00298EAFDE|nr:hypothetical protein [Peribacillus simplex]MDW7615161.1 hypothetical protein [Peribacillus simplex]
MNKQLYPRYEISRLLDISYMKKIVKILNENNIRPVLKDAQNIEYYKATDVEFLLAKQNELYQHYEANYLLYDEAKELGASIHDLSLSDPTELPVLIRIKKFYKRKMVYLQSSLNKRIEKRELIKVASCYTSNEVIQLFQIRPSDVKSFLKKHNIEPIINNVDGKGSRWSKAKIDTLLRKRENLYSYYDQNYMTYKETSKLLNVKMISSHTIKKYNLVIEALPTFIKFKRFKKTHVVFTKKLVYDYIKIKHDKGNMINEKKEKVLKERKKEVNIQKEIPPEENLNKNYTSLQDIRMLLGLSNTLVHTVLHENKITPKYILKNVKWYVKSEINQLKEIQDQLYYKFEKDYMTLNELRDYKISVNFTNKLTSTAVPRIIKKEKFKSLNVVYPRKVIEAYLNQRRREQLKTDLTIDVTIPFPIFERLVSEFNITFSDKAPLTQKYWISFVRQTLNKTKGNKQSVKKQIIRFVSITELLANVTRTKEIFAYTAKELSLLLFNREIYQEYQITFYTFFNTINNEMPFNIIDLNKIKNPNEEKRKKKISNKEVYSPTEFIELLNYVGNVELHKHKSIKDIHVGLCDLKKYKKYDSAWLYVLLHMNNGWRSADFAYKIPRLELPDNILTISDLEKNDLSIDDAKFIVVQLSSKLQSLKHSKNQKTNYFFCSEELLYPLANALIISELRTRIFKSHKQYLIDFKNERNDMLKGTHDSFFENYKKNFKFSSLKMNRTLIGLMSDVIKKKTNRNPLEISKFIRNHSDLDTTNSYINIPQEHLDYIASQLFDKGYFGYTYDLFTKALLEAPSKNTENIMKKSALIKKVFGDIYKIENLARYINILEQEDEDLLHYLNEHSEKELQEKMLLLNLGQLPAKEANYQCIFGKCLFLERDCNRCPFAVPHFYALTQIGGNMLRRIKEYQEIHNSSMYQGEKVRISNLLISDLLILSNAKQKFGEEILSAFIKIDYEDLKEQIRLLPSPYEFMTIKGV